MQSSTAMRPRSLRPLALLAVLFLLAPGCARTPKASEQAAPPPSAEPALDICAALRKEGPLRQRLEKQLPLRVGGLILVLQGAEPSEVERAFASLELSGTRVVRCAAGDIVAWAPGIDESGATGLESAVISGAPRAKVTERDLVPPDAASPVRARQ